MTSIEVIKSYFFFLLTSVSESMFRNLILFDKCELFFAKLIPSLDKSIPVVFLKNLLIFFVIKPFPQPTSK